VGTFLDVYEQEAGGAAAELVAAKASGVLPASVPVVGFASLKSINGNPERKDTVRLDWTYGDWKVAATSLHYDGFTQNLSDGRAFPIDSMTTYNMNVAYKFSILDDVDSRVRLGINNLTDERAPFADDSFGYFADQHRDLGRYYYLDFQFKVI
jgi:outer membrane receptor protein involved in Fe transport